MDAEITATIISGCPSRVVVENEEEKAATEAMLAGDCGVLVEVEEADTATEPGYVPAVETAASEAAEEDEQAPERVCDLQPGTPWAETICAKIADAAADQVIALLRKQWLEA